ncbi:unnamed protein product [Ilex paraguariensis]|uniref:DDE Tnp4 domain-containing protein n=1 Tax=Ilex paraguariensis TaxID=185542 RepID=A0ABC8SFE1_9AQUA
MACTSLHMYQPKINLGFVIKKVFYHKMCWQLAHLTSSLYSFILDGKAQLRIHVCYELSLMIRIRISLRFLKVVSKLAITEPVASSFCFCNFTYHTFQTSPEFIHKEFYVTGKYYLVDPGYSNRDGFIAPFQGVRYDLHEYRGVNQLPRNAKELFNHRHSSLRNAIQKSFNVLKMRFPILKLAPQYAFHTQRDIVIAACVIHNHIRREERNDLLFNSVEGGTVDDGLPDLDDQPDMLLAASIQEQIASSLRDSITAAMWNDFVHKWDEW